MNSNAPATQPTSSKLDPTVEFRAFSQGDLFDDIMFLERKPRLVIASEDRREVIALPKAETTIGRDPDCDIVLTHTTVSALHASIRFEKGGFVIQDLESRNGIVVHDQRLPSGTQVEIHSDTALTIGTLPCLFLVDELQERDELDPLQDEADRDRRLVSYCVRTRQITPSQGHDILDDLQESEQTLGELLVLKELLSARAWAEVKSQENVILIMLGNEEKKQRSPVAALALAAVGAIVALPARKMGLA